MNVERIVIGYDFSDEANVALEQGLDVARRFGAEVVLVHAFSAPVPVLAGEEGLFTLGEHWEKWRLDESGHRDAQLARVARDAASDVPVTHRIVYASAAKGVVDAARELRANLVVVGTHGRSGMRRILLGSVAEKVARHATAALIARPGSGPGGYQRVLVPTDFSTHADLALEFATRVVSDGGVVELFHVWETPMWLASAATSRTKAVMAEQIEVKGAELVARCERSDINVRVVSTEGAASAAIRARLHEGDHQLVVLGGRGRHRVAHWLLGGVAETTVRYAPCSVAIVKATSGRRKGGAL